MIPARYFRAPVAVYEAARAGLDAEFGHPYEATAADGTVVRTETCLPPAATLPEDGLGRVVVSISVADCERPEALPHIEALLGAGYIVEIQQEDFFLAQG